MTLDPIGTVRSCFGGKFGVPRQPGLCPSAWGELVFHETYRSPEAIRGIDLAIDDGVPILVFSFHSPSLVPGNTPYVTNPDQLDQFYDWWRQVFAHLTRRNVKPTSVKDIISLPGFSIFYRYANQGFLYVTLKPWEERADPQQHVRRIIQRLNAKFYLGIPEARVFAINEPPISGMGNIAGFDYRLLALDGDREKLDKTAREVIAVASKDPRLGGARNVASPNVQTLFVDVDRNKAKTLGVPLSDVYATIGTLLGSSFVNQFSAFGTNLKVKLQADEKFRSDPAYLQRFYVRNAGGNIVPISTLASVEYRSAPIALTRYNGYPAVQISGNSAPAAVPAKPWPRWRKSPLQRYPRARASSGQASRYRKKSPAARQDRFSCCRSFSYSCSSPRCGSW